MDGHAGDEGELVTGGLPQGVSTGLRVHRSARVEELLDPLVRRLRTDAPADPFHLVQIAVQSRGMERWLSHQLAQRLDPSGGGIRASIAFPFPGSVIARVIEAAGIAEQGAPDPWEPDRLVWPILELLQQLRHLPDLAGITRYLRASSARPSGPDSAADGVVDRRAWQLARGIADVFDRYALYRPDLATAWSAGWAIGPDQRMLDDRDRWQATLWRELSDRIGDPTARLGRAIAALGDPTSTVDVDVLPADISFFGISTLPERHLDLLAALATRTGVHLYLPTSSPARWRAIAAALRAGGEVPDASHPLLVSSGRLGDDAARLVLARSAGMPQPGPGTEAEDGAGHGRSAPTTLLQALQEAVHEDVAPGSGPARQPAYPLPVTASGLSRDRSIQVHSCHGPGRQAEVLREVLLGVLADDSSLEPRDVIVMTPDIETFAPLVQAAFADGGEGPSLPVRIADHELGRTNAVADALLSILDLAGSRASASDVLDLLGREPVAARFRLDRDEVSRAARWVADAGIRWAVDEHHRELHGQPRERVHTWRFGLDRLLLGVTMPDEDHRIVGDVVPYDHMEGDDVHLLGRLADACSTLFDLLDGLREPRTLEAWRDASVAVLDRCIEVEPRERWRIQEIRAALDELTAVGMGPAIGEPDARGRRDGTDRKPLVIDLGAARALVEGVVGRPRGAAGYETGAITVCAMVPMRSIPHEVVCLLGMDDGALPRASRGLGFDLTERDERIGDRDRRHEDRALFLEALLAARRHLVVTTTGRDVRTNEERPPAVPLAELLDVLDRTATTGRDGLSVRDAITTEHPLQRFGPRNFGVDEHGAQITDVPPLSFDRTQLDAAEAAHSRVRVRDHFLPHGAPLPAPDDDPDADRVVQLADLVLALHHPTRLLLRRRLHLYLRDEVAHVEDHEPFGIDPLLGYRLGSDVLARGDDAVSSDAWIATLIGSGTVPAGTPGRHELSVIADEVVQLRTCADDLLRSCGLPVLGVGQTEPRLARLDLEIAGRRLVGEVGGLVSNGAGTLTGRVRLEYVRPRPRSRLGSWVEHLALTAAGETDLVSGLVTRGPSRGKPPTSAMLAPLDGDPAAARQSARAVLADLLAIHDAALSGPVPLFEKASYQYADSRRLGKAREAFAADDFSSGDVDEDVAQAYGADVELDDVLMDADDRQRFAELAVRVWRPMIDHECESPDLLAARSERLRPEVSS